MYISPVDSLSVTSSQKNESSSIQYSRDFAKKTTRQRDPAKPAPAGCRRSKSSPPGCVSPLSFISNNIRDKLQVMQCKCRRSPDNRYINKGQNPPLHIEAPIWSTHIFTDTRNGIPCEIGLRAGHERPYQYGERERVEVVEFTVLVSDVHRERGRSSVYHNDCKRRNITFRML
ncbi:hypothetical protein EV424DRAFT_1383599, partial [Suillus variegatus]